MMRTDCGQEVAQLLRFDLSLPTDISVNLEYVTENIEAAVKVRNLGSNVLGACRTDGLKRKILLHEDLCKNNNRYRFTLAHEIGHLLVHHGSHYCKPEFFDSFSTQNTYEYEANSFAAELLMHKSTIRKILKKRELDMKLVKEITIQYEVSLMAAAIRLIQLYEDSAILIYHDGNKIIWSVKSAGCSYWKSEIELPRGFKSHTTKKIITDYTEWFCLEQQSYYERPESCEEETIYFTRLNKYLTVVKFLM